ncbi:MAG TPA: CvpA family protein [Bacteroidales bacterium]|nr:CvpA family protein [Bacteroidales bacterium]
MNYVDYIIIAVVVIGFLLGYKDGLVRKLIGLAGFVVGVVLAFEFADQVGRYLAPIFNNEEDLSRIVSGILIFLVIILITSLIKRIVHPFDKVNRFLNQLLGGISGAIQIIFFISGFLLFLNIFNFPNDKAREGSLLYDKVYKVIPVTIDMVIGENSKTKNFIRQFIEQKNNFDFEDIDVDSTLAE